MMRFLVLLALTVVAFAEDPALAIKLPLVSDAAPDDGKEAAPRLVINLTKDGRLSAEGKQLTLNRLGAGLRGAKRSYKLRQAKRGLDGEFDPGTGVKVPALYVLLRADADAPWRHVEWIQTVLAEQKYVRFQFAAIRKGPEELGKVSVPLPAPVSLESIPGEPATEITIEVQAIADKEQESEWGPESGRTRVKLATGVLFRVGAEEFRDIEAAKKRLATICKAAKEHHPKPDRIVCAIRATGKVPCRHVIQLAALFRKRGMEHVHLYSMEATALPPPSVRDADLLPYPKENDLPASVAGSAGISEIEEPKEEDG